MDVLSVLGDLSQCSTCIHLRPWWDGGGERSTCSAYHGGIPDELWLNVVDHRQPADGDHGVRWESGEAYPEWALPGPDARRPTSDEADPQPPVAPAVSEESYRTLLSAFERVAGKDTHPGGESLHLYWTTSPEGLAKWLGHPHEWTSLYHHLLSHMDGNELLAKATASKWFAEVKGHPVGEEKGKNPFGPG